MSGLSNCIKCHRLFVKSNVSICDVCRKEEELAFDKVYKFLRLRENRSATVNEISKSTGVDEDLIMKFVKEGRLRTTNFPNLGYPCEKCGEKISNGKMCENCQQNLNNDLKAFEEEEKLKENTKTEKYTYYSR